MSVFKLLATPNIQVKLSGLEHVGGNPCVFAVCFIIVSSVCRWFLVSLVVALFPHQASEWTNHQQPWKGVNQIWKEACCWYYMCQDKIILCIVTPMTQGLVCSTWSAGLKHLVCQPCFAFATWILCPRPACGDVLKAFATGISILAPAQVRQPIIAGDKLALCLSFCEIASRYFFGTVGQSSPAMSLSKASLSNWVTGCLLP